MEISQIVNLSTIGLLVLFGALGFFKHFRSQGRGFFGALLDLVFVIANVIISIFVAEWVADLIVTPDTMHSVLDLINGDNKEGFFAEILEQMEVSLHKGGFLQTADLRLVFAIFEAILTPIIFIAVFFIDGTMLWVVKLFVRNALPKTRNTALRICGGAVGAVKSVLVICIYVAPIVGFATYGINTIKTASDTIEMDGLQDISNQIVEYEDIFTTGTLNVINTCGGQWLFETLTTVHVDDVKVSLTDETENIFNIYEAVIPLTEINSTNFTQEEADLIEDAIDEIENSEYLTALVASLMEQTAKELYEEDKVLILRRPILGASFDPVVDRFLEAWSDTSRADLIDDLRTFLEVFRSTINNGLFEQLNSTEGDIFKVVENSKFYSDILIELHRNERTRPIVPSLSNALQSYLYEVYEEINGFPYGSGEIDYIDEGKINEDSLALESERIATAIREIRKFADSTAGAVYVGDMVKLGDFVALGTALNQMRDSVFFNESYEFLLNSILHSDACRKLGIFDTNFVNSAVGDPDNPMDDADMVQLLVSRQNLAKLTMALWDGDKPMQEESIKVIIENLSFDPDNPAEKAIAESEAAALKELADLENLNKYGVGGSKGNTVSTVTETLIETIYDHEYDDKNGDGIVNQADIDIETTNTAHIITIIAGINDNIEGVSNVFGDSNSKTGESADDFVSAIMSSSIANDMIENALNENSDDPYGIHSALTAEDRSNIEAALENEYVTGGGHNKTELENLASILGVSFRP